MGFVSSFKKLLGKGILLAALPLDGNWIGVPQSAPPCFFQFKKIKCAQKTLSLQGNFNERPKAFDEVALVGLVDPRVAPELAHVRKLMGNKRVIFFSLTDLKIPDYYALPGNFEPLKARWHSPWIIVESEEQVWWRRPDSGSKWRNRFGHFVAFQAPSQLVIRHEKGKLTSIDLKENRTDWEVPLPMTDVGRVDWGRRLGPLNELNVHTPQRSSRFWLNRHLGVWVQPSKAQLSVREEIAGPKILCPHPHKLLPRYPSWDFEGDALCFNYKSLVWERNTKKGVATPAEFSTSDVVKFWKRWLEQLSQPKGLSIREFEKDKISVSAYFKTQAEINKLKWYIGQLCKKENCGLTMNLRRLPSKEINN